MSPAPDRPQTYANHRSFPPLAHLAAGLVILVETCRRGYVAATDASGATVWAAVVAVAVLVVWFYARRSAQIVQDRVIRLEMRLRLQRVLGDERREEIEQIAVPNLVALRFASDAELPDLVQRLAQGGFDRPRSLKRAITSWRADWLRV